MSWTFPTGGSLIVGLEASKPGGDQAVARQVIAVNGTPTARAGGPYRIPEGGAATLTATGADPEGQPLAFAWDLDNNGSFETPGVTARFAARLDGPTTTTATVQACDSVICVTDKATITILNMAPRANAGPDRRGRRRQRLRFRVRASDTGPDRLKATWSFGDGTRAKGMSVSHAFRRAGRYTVTVTVTDDDGGRTRDTVKVRVRK